MKRTRKYPWRTRSQIQCSRMSVAFDIRWETVSAAMSIATSLSQNNGVAGWVAHVGQDFAFLCRDAGSGLRGGRGRRRLIGHAAACPTRGKFSGRPDVRPRILADVEDGPWWRGWGKPARMRVRRWRVESCRLRICRSTAGILPPPEAPWPVREWLRGRGQAQWGTGAPGIRRREGCRWRRSCRGKHRENADEREGERRIQGRRR
jgi:hypothetical protein